MALLEGLMVAGLGRRAGYATALNGRRNLAENYGMDEQLTKNRSSRRNTAIRLLQLTGKLTPITFTIIYL